MRTLLLTSILLALWAGGCDKIGKTRVSGRVINAITNEPIPNVAIWGQAFVCKGSCIGTGSIPVELFTTQTDSEGYFEAESNERGDDPVCYIYTRYADTLKFFASSPKSGTLSSTKLSLHEDNEIEFRVVPVSAISVWIKNVQYQDDQDHFMMRVYNPKLEWDDIGNWFGGYGYADGYQYEDHPIPAGWTHIAWKVTRNGTTQEFLDSVYAKPGHTAEFRIEF